MLFVPVRQEPLSVVYTVIGIMFSIAMSQLMSFSFVDVENQDYIDRYRCQLSSIRTIFIVLFVISTILFLLLPYDWKFHWKIFKFDAWAFECVSFCYSLVYFIVNFISLVKLKDEIEDDVRKSKYGDKT